MLHPQGPGDGVAGLAARPVVVVICVAGSDWDVRRAVDEPDS